MTLDASKPTDVEEVSDLPAFERETRQAINDLETLVGVLGATSIYTELVVPGGVTTLITGTHVANVPVELVKISSGVASTISDISGGTEGQWKIFYFADSNITFNNDQVTIQLDQPIVVTSYTFAIHDVLALAFIDGVWCELFRRISAIV
jgi:hypothetical protein